MDFVKIVLGALVFSFFPTKVLAESYTDKSFSDSKIESVPILEKASVKTSNEVIALSRVGAGLRIKALPIIPDKKVYAVELLVSNPAAYVRTKEAGLSSLDNMKAVSFNFTFLMNLSWEKVKKSYEEALRLNGTDPSEKPFSDFLLEVEKNGNLKEGQKITLVGYKREQKGEYKEILDVELPKTGLVSFSGSKGFLSKIFAIWLGKNSEKELENLKEALLFDNSKNKKK